MFHAGKSASCLWGVVLKSSGLDHTLDYRQKLWCTLEVGEKPYGRMEIAVAWLGLYLGVCLFSTLQRSIKMLLSVNCLYSFRRAGVSN